MLFSAHLAETNPLAALRRRTPDEASVPGLQSARTGICAPFTQGPLPSPQLGREALLACWESEDALDRFLEDDPTGQAFAGGWQARMELVRAVGIWPGASLDMVEAAGTKARDMSGPSIAVTVGTAYLRTAVPFLKVTKGLDRQFLATPSGIWGTGITNLPQRLVATLTIWESLDEASEYMRTGAHGTAVKNHFDPQKDPTGHTYVTGGGFFGFRPLSVSGSVSGRNPLSEEMLPLPR